MVLWFNQSAKSIIYVQNLIHSLSNQIISFVFNDTNLKILVDHTFTWSSFLVFDFWLIVYLRFKFTVYIHKNLLWVYDLNKNNNQKKKKELRTIKSMCFYTISISIWLHAMTVVDQIVRISIRWPCSAIPCDFSVKLFIWSCVYLVLTLFLLFSLYIFIFYLLNN